MTVTQKNLENAKKAMKQAEKNYENLCCEMAKRKANNEITMTVEDVINLMRAIHDTNFFNSLLQRKMPDISSNNTPKFVPTPECIAARNALDEAVTKFCEVADTYRFSQTKKNKL